MTTSLHEFPFPLKLGHVATIRRHLLDCDVDAKVGAQSVSINLADAKKMDPIFVHSRYQIEPDPIFF